MHRQHLVALKDAPGLPLPPLPCVLAAWVLLIGSKEPLLMLGILFLAEHERGLALRVTEITPAGISPFGTPPVMDCADDRALAHLSEDGLPIVAEQHTDVVLLGEDQVIEVQVNGIIVPATVDTANRHRERIYVVGDPPAPLLTARRNGLRGLVVLEHRGQ